MGTSPNDLPPIVGDVLVQPRLLVTPQQVQAAIDDVNKLMQNTHTFFRDYEREIFRRSRRSSSSTTKTGRIWSDGRRNSAGASRSSSPSRTSDGSDIAAC
jgi:hypothetical protein